MDFNPYSRKLYTDPHRAHRRLREEAPVTRNERFGFWTLSRYDDVLAALKDWRTYSSASGITLVSFTGLKPMIILMDPPRHDELRALLLRAFTPRRIATLESRIRGIAREIIGEFRRRGECEFVRDFAAPFPTTVIAELLGVDAADREQFKVWSDAIMTSASVEAASLERAYGEIFAYFERIVAERRRKPGDDLVSALVDAVVGAELSDDEILGFCALLLIAANETMASFLGNAMLTLDRHPEVREQLVAEPALLHTATDELIRWFRTPAVRGPEALSLELVAS